MTIYTGKCSIPFLPNNMYINGLPITSFFITHFWLDKWAYYGDYGCSATVDSQLFGFAKVEGLSEIIDGRTLTLEIKTPSDKIYFTLSPQLEKYINFIGL
ncbi:MAG: hypothetical protein U9O65_05400 [Thermotogota bacterium]|nr:hypothetical protein [Thermotogota bacterium]